MTTPPTLAAFVDARLREAILTGRLAPGDKLRSERLAAEWGVSPTPVREAFQRLAGEGMVVIEPQRGARVATVDATEAAELYELRLTLEPQALQSAMEAAAEAGPGSYRQGVESAHRELAGTHQTVSGFFTAHRAFHLSMLEGCANRRLHRLVVQLHDHAQRFQMAGARYDRRGDTVAEHRALCAAVVAGDVEAARGHLVEHLTHTLQAVQALAAH